MGRLKYKSLVTEIIAEKYFDNDYQAAKVHAMWFLRSEHFDHARVSNPPYAIFGQSSYDELDNQVQEYAIEELGYSPVKD